MLVWLNDALLPVEQARVDPRDRGLLLGDGLFETLLAVDGQPQYLSEHLARLRCGCAVLALPLKWSEGQISEAVQGVLEANDLMCGRAAVRITLTRGIGPRGLRTPVNPSPNLFVSATRAQATMGSVRAIVSSYRRNEHSPLSRVKSLSYLENVLAAEEARRAGVDEALLLNTAGQLAEASAANVFLVRDGQLWTPRLRDGPLAGIIRAQVLDLAPESGWVPSERACTPEDLRCADEVFLTSSVAIVRPVVQIDGAAVGSGQPGPCVRALLARAEFTRQVQCDALGGDHLQPPE